MRARNIKPGFFHNENLAECRLETRLLFIGLWCMADREGRIEDRPKKIKMELFPSDNIDCDSALNELQRWGFIVRYEIGCKYIQIVNFLKHQRPHIKEAASTIPPPDEHQLGKVQAPTKESASTDEECLIPDSLIPDSLIQQLPGQTPKGDLPIIISFPLNRKGETFGFTQKDIDQWRESFPGVDIDLEIKKCRQWSIDNPSRRKTAKGIRQHISSWLGKEQDRSRERSNGKIGNGSRGIGFASPGKPGKTDWLNG